MDARTVRASPHAGDAAPRRFAVRAPELRDDSARRLGNAALQYAAVFALAYAVYRLTDGPHPILVVGPAGVRWHGPGLGLGDAAAALAVAGSLALAWAARRGRLGRALDPARVLRVGLAYEVVAAFGIAFVEHWRPYPPEFFPRGISWACVWITVFPMVVPAPPRVAWLAAFAAASTGPLALALSVAAGHPAPSPAVAAALFVPTYLAAALAAFPARLVLALRRQAARAAQMGSYRLVELLGRGGMGEVWRAEHRTLARAAAIKLVKPERLGGRTRAAELLRRFEREAAATAALRSPHTVEVYDFGSTDDGTLFYVMELLDGVDLETLVDVHGPVPPARAVHLLLQICHSLAEAHQQGLVHRDIKPANVYLCRRGLDHDVAKVLDFGLVASVPGERGDGGALASFSGDDASARLTAEGTVPGTPAFMAPEVARGQPADARADLYSLGCVGWWLLSGRLVFERASPLALMLAHANDPLEEGELSAAQEVPDGLARIVLSCLAKDPADRPQSALVLMRRLLGCDAGAAWDAQAAADWWARNLSSGPGAC